MVTSGSCSHTAAPAACRFTRIARRALPVSRPLRLEYPGAVWHVTSRGNERRDIFRSDSDRLFFLDTLEGRGTRPISMLSPAFSVVTAASPRTRT